MLVCCCFSQWMPVLAMLAGRWLSPRPVGILDMPDSQAPEPMLALPVWPQPMRSLPLLRPIRSLKSRRNASLVKRQLPAKEWKPAQRLSGPKFEEPS